MHVTVHVFTRTCIQYVHTQYSFQIKLIQSLKTLGKQNEHHLINKANINKDLNGQIQKFLYPSIIQKGI